MLTPPRRAPRRGAARRHTVPLRLDGNDRGNMREGARSVPPVPCDDGRCIDERPCPLQIPGQPHLYRVVSVRRGRARERISLARRVQETQAAGTRAVPIGVSGGRGAALPLGRQSCAADRQEPLERAHPLPLRAAVRRCVPPIASPFPERQSATVAGQRPLVLPNAAVRSTSTIESSMRLGRAWMSYLTEPNELANRLAFRWP